MAVQGRIRATQHEATPARVDAEEVAVAPDTGILLEVGLPITHIAWIVPETHRHRRHRLRDDHLPDLVDDASAIGVEGCQGHAELWRLDLAGIDRLYHHAAAEATADVRPAAAGLHPHVALYVLVKPEHAFRRDRRPCERDTL